jgi:hypothetical protein
MREQTRSGKSATKRKPEEKIQSVAKSPDSKTRRVAASSRLTALSATALAALAASASSRCLLRRPAIVSSAAVPVIPRFWLISNATA